MLVPVTPSVRQQGAAHSAVACRATASQVNCIPAPHWHQDCPRKGSYTFLSQLATNCYYTAAVTWTLKSLVNWLLQI